jgi:glycosyltransferase involved in cell wall biosynthesis
MTKKPRISVLMPAYNAEKYIAEAIESILKQTYKDFELIIVDDASTDDTAKIIKSYAKRDKRIKYYKNEKNSGVTITLNNGLKHCSGDYIARMDSDDVSMKKRFEEQVREMDKGSDLIGTNITFIDENGKKSGTRKYSNEIDKVIIIESPLAHPTVMFRKEFLKKTGNYRPEYNSAEDYDLWIRFYRKNAKIKIIQKPLLLYRQHKDTVKNLKTKKTIRTTIRVKQNAKREGMNFKTRGNLRIMVERAALLLPRKLILKIFYLLKRK